ncbi:MAG: GNAT family N-acetyltransferase [Candidatus Absconditabacterales bacterium]|nr:GNAT family N-acetyltransferase [Candidatus Absconditabacterales bacterium]
MPLTIIKGTHDDRPYLQAIRIMMHELYPDLFPGPSPHRYPDSKRQKIMTDKHFFFLCDENGQCRGKVHITPWLKTNEIKDYSQGIIFGLFVHPDYQRQGRGKKLLQTAMDYARNHIPIKTLHLTVKASNSKAIGLYQSLGWIRTNDDDKGPIKMIYKFF